MREPPPDPEQPEDVQVAPVRHAGVVVMTRYCDLFQDHNEIAELGPDSVAPIRLRARDVILCDAFKDRKLRRPEVTGINSGVWKAIRSNQKARYHFLPEASVGDPSEALQLPSLTLDFTKVFTLPTRLVVRGIENGSTTRCAALPDLFREHLIQRFWAFHSQVSLPR